MARQTRLTATLISILWMILTPSADAQTFDRWQDIERAVINEQWSEVMKQCAHAPVPAQDAAVPRLVHAHACVATNRNNQAVVLFASIHSAAQREVWEHWTASLVDRHPEARVAHYLRGDALLRSGRLQEAEQRFTTALGDRDDFALALNARGVTYVHMGLAESATNHRARNRQWQKARNDFERAIRRAPDFAETYASLGNLQLLRQAPTGAITSFGKALRLSSDYALAYNGMGCAEFGRGQWEQANRYYTAAAKTLPLAVFLANLRGLADAITCLDHPGQEHSPLFRFTDFLDWQTLCEKTTQRGDVFAVFYGGQLPVDLTPDVVSRMNEALERPSFYDTVKNRINLDQIVKRLEVLIEETQTIRPRRRDRLTDTEKAAVVELNRRLLEHHYPHLIARHDQRRPGHQLTITQGLVSGTRHRQGLSNDQILRGQGRVDYLWRPMADFTESMPLVGSIGKQWNRHLNNATKWNNLTMQQRTGSGVHDLMPGGVSTELHIGFVDRGDWPVGSAFGLLPGGLPESPKDEETQRDEQ